MRLLVACTVMLAGCAMISGLDQIKVNGSCDACAGDASTDASADSPIAAPDTGASDALDDADAPSTSDGIQCKDQKCAAVSQVCCVTPQTMAMTCTAPNMCTTIISFACDDALDCDVGKVCCLQTEGFAAKKSVCAFPGACTSSTDVVLCDTGQANACPQGKSCVPISFTNLPPGYTGCK